ncbi:MAG TPA: D-alanyl-D-alanine carboxypeptidase [Acidimicrobiales bacterium]|nr:D-alanyl-D-alanine carboxypeptidase [Acidimicrobiales bacterium]
MGWLSGSGVGPGAGRAVVAALALATAALAAGGSALADPAGAAGARPAGPTPTPLLSVRRVPGWLAATVATQRVTAAASAPLAALGAAAATSCLVADQGTRVLVAAQPTVPLVPASNMKLLTAVAALDRLGPGYRFTTSVVAAAPLAAGVVTGDLYLVGGGDPVLRTPQYEATIPDAVPPFTSLPALAAQVAAAGVRQVTGTVVGDGTRYDALRTVPGWKPVYAAEGDAGPLSGLDVDDGFHVGIDGYRADTDPDQQAAATFAQLLVADGVQVGPVSPPPPGTPPELAAPALTAAEAAVAALAVAGPAPGAATPVTTIESAPLAQLLAAVLAPSDDTAAEMLTKELGRQTAGAGTTAAGTAAIAADLAADGLPVEGLVVDDGSGLHTGDRVTCALLAAVLARAEATGSPLLGDLAVTGETGTLRHRLTAAGTAGRVRGKTGTLDGVSALSGVVLPAAGPATATALRLRAPVVFSLIMDGVRADAAVAAGDAVATALAAYPQPPDPGALAPVP